MIIRSNKFPDALSWPYPILPMCILLLLYIQLWYVLQCQFVITIHHWTLSPDQKVIFCMTTSRKKSTMHSLFSAYLLSEPSTWLLLLVSTWDLVWALTLLNNCERRHFLTTFAHWLAHSTNISLSIVCQNMTTSCITLFPLFLLNTQHG